jgi:hypothetical protein
MDEVAIGYETEQREYRITHPRPTLKKTMLDLAGTGAEQ